VLTVDAPLKNVKRALLQNTVPTALGMNVVVGYNYTKHVETCEFVVNTK